MSALFPYTVEYEADQMLHDGVIRNFIQELSGDGAQDLFDLLCNSPRTRWARWYREGVEGNKAKYYRLEDEFSKTGTIELVRQYRFHTNDCGTATSLSIIDQIGKELEKRGIHLLP
jgi:hypothetical protein